MDLDSIHSSTFSLTIMSIKRMPNADTISRLISSVIFAATVVTIGTAGTTAPETFQLLRENA